MTKPLDVGKVLVERLKRFTENMETKLMIDQKTWTDLLGEPQGNEYVDGKDIVREVSLHQFRILWSFDSNQEANRIYTYWTTMENN
jgi:hypothetical protein